MPVSKQRKNAKTNRPVPPSYLKEHPLIFQDAENQPAWEDCTDIYSKVKDLADATYRTTDEVFSSIPEDAGERGKRTRDIAGRMNKLADELMSEARTAVCDIPRRRGMIKPIEFPEYSAIQGKLIDIHKKCGELVDLYQVDLRGVLLEEIGSKSKQSEDMRKAKEALDAAPYSENALKD